MLFITNIAAKADTNEEIPIRTSLFEMMPAEKRATTDEDNKSKGGSILTVPDQNILGEYTTMTVEKDKNPKYSPLSMIAIATVTIFDFTDTNHITLEEACQVVNELAKNLAKGKELTPSTLRKHTVKYLGRPWSKILEKSSAPEEVRRLIFKAFSATQARDILKKSANAASYLINKMKILDRIHFASEKESPSSPFEFNHLSMKNVPLLNIK